MKKSFLIRLKARMVFILLFLALMPNILISQYNKPPGVDWKKVTYRDKTLKHQGPITQENSGDEWWYSHKNLYDPTSGAHIGYAAVGYIADYVKSSDKPQIEQDIRDIYNEGSDSPFNPIPLSGSLFITGLPQLIGLPPCEDLFDVMTATTNVDAVDRRTEHCGMVARLDLQGNMVWCRILTIHGEGLQELVVQGSSIYVVGTHYGVKRTWTSGTRDFLPYNGNTSDKFDKTIHTSLAKSGQFWPAHMYVAKLDFDGNKAWEGIYGDVGFSAGANAAYNVHTEGRDIIFNSSNNLLYAVGRSTSSAANGGMFVAAIDPSNGALSNFVVLPRPTGFQNVHGNNSTFINGNTICQTHVSGTMAVGGTLMFSNWTTSTVDQYRGLVYSIKPDLTLNTSWSAANPVIFHQAASTPQDQSMGFGTGYQGGNYIWEINYHSASSSVLVGLLDECYECGVSGHNRARGKIYRLNAQTGAIFTSFGDMGSINAYDLRIGVVETADGGYAGVSSRRNSIDFPALSALGVYSTCPNFTNISNGPNDPWATVNYFNDPRDAWGVWDTDPLVRKFDNADYLQWEWSEDIVPGRSRALPPGDFKRQECLYKISETPDKSLVISGNCSYNHDDNYMVKLFPDCNANVNYDYDYSANPSGQGWSGSASNTTKTFKGIVTVSTTLTLSGSSTKWKFADSKLTGVPSYILVKPGGKLILQNGAEITSIDNTTCPGSMWDGIYVSGTSSLAQGANYNTVVNQGFLSMNSVTLSNARNAITTGQVDAQGNFMWGTTGGVVYAVTSDFVNNHRDVQYMHYLNPSNPNVNLGQFVKCRFLTNSALNEGAPTGHVSMYNVMNVRFRGCEFSYNAGSAYPQEKHGYGILSMDATYNVSEYCNNALCTSSQRTEFNNLTNGIMVLNANPLRVVNVDHAIFSDSHSGTFGLPRHGIIISSANTTKITRNEFNQSALAYGIYINHSQNYGVNSNTLTGSGLSSSSAGILASQSYAGLHKIYRNDINDYSCGILSQFANSGIINTTSHQMKYDGLLMNCDRMYDNLLDIFVTGNTTGSFTKFGAVRQVQGFVDNQSNPNPKYFVRNWYTASCTGFGKKYEASNAIKNIEHAAHGSAGVPNPNTQPTSGCKSSNVISIDGGNFSYDFSDQCPSNELIVSNENCPCKNCCVHDEITNAMSAARANHTTWENLFESEIDGGRTEDLLDLVSQGSAALFDSLLAHSPYLSDTVLKAYIHSGYPSEDLLEVHNANKPFSAEAWSQLESRGFSTTVMEDFENQQDDYPVSQRTILENEYGRTRTELEFITAEKLNYFLTDTLSTSRDSVLAIVLGNFELLSYAKKLAPRAYAAAGHWERAFEFADSLSNVSGYEEIMGLELTLLALDTSSKGIYSLPEDENLYQAVAAASDSTKNGFWQARAVNYMVFGKNMHLKYLLPDIGGERFSRPGDNMSEELPFNISEEAHLTSFIVYPNPAYDEVYVAFRGDKAEQGVFRLLDPLGKVLLEMKSDAGNPTRFSTLGLQNGVYFIDLISTSRMHGVKKLIIQR